MRILLDQNISQIIISSTIWPFFWFYNIEKIWRLYYFRIEGGQRQTLYMEIELEIHP